jgi:hypothetical protein
MCEALGERGTGSLGSLNVGLGLGGGKEDFFGCCIVVALISMDFRSLR